MGQQKKFKYIYGPVYSWRLGMSLGIDPISTKQKVCNFDCVYCQLGRTDRFENERKIFVETDAIIEEINKFSMEKIDFYTFSGRGEPTLAKNIGGLIKVLKNSGDRQVAVITNSSLIHRRDVQDDLLLSDFVLAKIDAYDQESLTEVSRPMQEIEFSNIIEGLKAFRKKYFGKLALQIMFVGQNKGHAKQIAKIVKEINADEIQINTPLRPAEVRPLGENALAEIKLEFEGLNVMSVYEAKKIAFKPMNDKDTLLRHGNYKNNNNG